MYILNINPRNYIFYPKIYLHITFIQRKSWENGKRTDIVINFIRKYKTYLLKLHCLTNF